MSIEEVRRKVSQVCEDQRIKRLDLFGSMARSKGLSGGDYDFLAAFEEMSPREYSKRFFGTLHGLEDALQAPIDLLTPESIKRKSLRDRIDQEKVCIYESRG